MKKLLLYLFLIIICVFAFLSGCTENSNEDKIEFENNFLGSWKDDDFNGAEWFFTFFDDGTYDTNRTVPGTWEILNESHLELFLNQDSVTYIYTFSNDYKSLTLSSVGFDEFSWTYNLTKIE
jgi:hypothetical protein